MLHVFSSCMSLLLQAFVSGVLKYRSLSHGDNWEVPVRHHAIIKGPYLPPDFNSHQFFQIDREELVLTKLISQLWSYILLPWRQHLALRQAKHVKTFFFQQAMVLYLGQISLGLNDCLFTCWETCYSYFCLLHPPLAILCFLQPCECQSGIRFV